ncbi:hypothetical protein [Alicyclobacillus fodiniaquatilis]|uniref:Uncharacterized protein n=1 Tax=Alicyclobacillus fodiniaquatilis TaxID=1661150 RepID=A0ABW4JII0_9BACL
MDAGFQSTILPLVTSVMKILSAIAGAWTLFHLVKAGLGIMSGQARAKEEGLSRFKFVIIGGVISLGSYFFAEMIGVLMTAAVSTTTATNAASVSISPTTPPTINGIPGQSSGGNPILAWVINAVTGSIDAVLDMLSGVLMAFSGFVTQTGLIKANILAQKSGANNLVLGMFAPKTWAGMMYIQHSLMWIVGVAALIYFVVQGMQVQAAPSSIIAKERLYEVFKSIFITAAVMALSPELINWATLAMSDITYWVLDMISAHTAALSNDPNRALSFSDLIFGDQPISMTQFFTIKVTSNLEFPNSLFRLVYAIVNLCCYVVYTWRRVFLALWISFLPVFYIGLVTGRNKTLIIHWWKEFIAYLLVPSVAALFLFASFVFIGN